MLKAKFNSSSSSLVYSTDSGRLCPQCHQPLKACACKHAATSKGDGLARVHRETKGRGGKSVCVITGLSLPAAELDTLCTNLKKRCGTGGTVKAGTIEIQGEHRDTLIAELTRLGFKAKTGGG